MTQILALDEVAPFKYDKAGDMPPTNNKRTTLPSGWCMTNYHGTCKMGECICDCHKD